MHINFYLKKDWSVDDIVPQKIDTGFINISSPELTALDLVYYWEQAGRMNRIATVLEGLSESMTADKLHATIMRYAPITAVQRLGFLLDCVLDKHELSATIKDYLSSVCYYPILLRPQKERTKMLTGNDYKVVQNVVIETEL